MATAALARTIRVTLPKIDLSMQTDRHLWQHETDWTLESGPDDAPSSIDITVPFDYRYGSPPSYWDPGAAPEIETGTPFYFDGTVLVEVNLIDAERDRVETWIAENPPEPDYGDDW
jgi:hypothetical protein